MSVEYLVGIRRTCRQITNWGRAYDWKDIVALGNGRWLWSPLLATFDDDRRQIIAEVLIYTDGEGTPHARKVTVESRDLSGHVDPRDLRLPIANVVRVAIALSALRDPICHPVLGPVTANASRSGPAIRRPENDDVDEAENGRLHGEGCRNLPARVPRRTRRPARRR
jgi:hypothetical protein